MPVLPGLSNVRFFSREVSWWASGSHAAATVVAYPYRKGSLCLCHIKQPGNGLTCSREAANQRSGRGSLMNMSLPARRSPMLWVVSARNNLRGKRLFNNDSGDGRGPGADFVSKHFRIPPRAVDDLAERMGWSTKRQQEWVMIELCPHEVCEGTPQQQNTKGEGDNLYTFGVSSNNGSFNCFRCGSKGSWFKLKHGINKNQITIEKPTMTSDGSRNG